MLIGSVAEAVGVNAKTIRYYEDIGLVPEAERDGSGYRAYGPDDVARLRFIRRAQHLGLRLDEIREILDLREHGHVPCDYVREVAGLRLAELDEKIEEMLAARDELASLLETAVEHADGHGEFCPLIERHRFSGEERTKTAADT